jgi:Glycosyl transferase family 2
LFTRDSVTVVTAATGHPMLGRCLQSVQQQTFGNIEHFIVPDGIEHRDKVHQAIRALGEVRQNVCAMALPHPTGLLGWCGHRIYGAVSLLCNTEFICFLDEDNWLEPEHVAGLVAEIRSTGADWGFSLRRIFDADANFVAPDICESLGNLHPVYNDDSRLLIDTNCFFLGRQVAATCAALWYRPAPPRGAGADRLLTHFLLENFPRLCSTRRHTVNYTAGSNARSARADFFLKGNRAMRERYPSGLPWETDRAAVNAASQPSPSPNSGGTR